MVEQKPRSRTIRSCLGLAAVAIALYSLCIPVAMAQVPAPPTTPDLPDVDLPDTPVPQNETDIKTDTDAEVQVDKANVKADADAEVQADPNAPADINARTRTRLDTEDTDADRPPRLDANSRTRTDTEAESRDRTDSQDQLNAGAGTSQRGRLGLQFSEGDQLIISQVATGGIAARAGLRIRDEIVSINGQRVATREELTTILNDASLQDGPTVIEFRRNGRLQQVNVNLMGNGRQGDRVESFYRGPEDGAPAYDNGNAVNGERYNYRSRRFNRWRRCR